MSGLSVSELILLFFFASNAIVLALWWGHASRQNRRRWYLTSRCLFQCKNCHHTFVSQEAVTVTRCPRCNATCVGFRDAREARLAREQKKISGH